MDMVSEMRDTDTKLCVDTRVYVIRPVAPTPRSEPSELHNLHRNSAAGLPQKNSQREWNVIMVWLAWL